MPQLILSIWLSLLTTIPGREQVYKSVDTGSDPSEDVHYPNKFLNAMEPPGTPPYKFALKVGSPICFWEIWTYPHLCNRTRLIVTKLMAHDIDAIMLRESGKGKDIFIPRIPLIPSNAPFPVRVCFAMSVNKSRGQTLILAGLQLEEPWFSHDQLYDQLHDCMLTEYLTVIMLWHPTGNT